MSYAAKSIRYLLFFGGFGSLFYFFSPESQVPSEYRDDGKRKQIIEYMRKAAEDKRAIYKESSQDIQKSYLDKK